MKLGYARVSTAGQDLHTQIERLKSQGVEESNIFVEKKSGRNIKDRKSLNELIKYARDNDTIFVTKIDRLARSIKDLHNLIEFFTENNISIVFIDNNLSYSPTDKNDPVRILLFNTLAAFAQFESDMIVTRTSEGRARAIKQGKKMGRKGQPSKNIDRAIHLYEDRETNNLSISEITQTTGVPKSTLYYELKKKRLISK